MRAWHTTHVTRKYTVMATFVLESCIQGHNVYKNLCTTSMGEELPCVREMGNVNDPYAVHVAMQRSSLIVGHIPRRIPGMFVVAH